jgi:hypothetical protein
MLMNLILTYIPDVIPHFVEHLITAIGVLLLLISFSLKSIPTIGKYFEPIRIIAFIITLVGVWYEGGIYVENTYKQESERKIAEADKRTAEANAKIQTVYVDKIQIVKDTKVVVHEKIRKVAVKVDSICKVAPEVITILNQSATNQLEDKK